MYWYILKRGSLAERLVQWPKIGVSGPEAGSLALEKHKVLGGGKTDVPSLSNSL